LSVKAVAAVCCALGVFIVLSPRVFADAGGLRRWSTNAQLTFSLPNTSGADVALDTARGRVVLVHFFATWCDTCREELKSLNRLAARASGKVRVLAIAVADSDQRVRRLIENEPAVFPILLDRDRAVAKSWKVAALPTTFVLDANLRPRLLVETDFAWDNFDPGIIAGLPATDLGKTHQSRNANTQ
jgi:peroxiredoxin